MISPRRTLASVLFLSLSYNACSADFVFQIIQRSDSVFMRGEGSLDLNGLTLAGNTLVSRGVLADCCFIVGQPPNNLVDIYVGSWTGPNVISNGGPFDPFHLATSGSGSGFGVDFMSQAFYAPNNYVTGSFIQGEALFPNETLASLQITEGTYSWVLGTNDLTLEITAITAVPEPGLAALPMLVAMGLALRRRSVFWPLAQVLGERRQHEA